MTDMHAPRLPVDIALAVIVGLLMAIGTTAVSAPGSSPDGLGWGLLAVSVVSLALRRRWPIGVMWVTILAGLAYTILGNPGGFFTVAIGVSIFTAAALRRRGPAVAGLVGGFMLFLAADVAWDTGHLLLGGGALWFGGWLTVAFLVGEVARNRSDHIELVKQRAAEEERTRNEKLLRRAGEERMEIARELHDVLAHSISIINVQAGAALRHLESDPARSREALTVVRDTGKRAMAELRSSIDVLRRSEDPAPTSPAPGLDEIYGLAERTRATGLGVEVIESGSAEVSPQVGLAAYRIVQESLTNVARHADATTATVTIERGESLVVRVDDDGRGASTDSTDGHGIEGMRERARTLQGMVEAGPKQDGGFRVEARFPLGGSR